MEGTDCAERLNGHEYLGEEVSTLGLSLATPLPQGCKEDPR